MDTMLGGMTWEEEFDLLTKFHENNLGPAGNNNVYSEGEINKKPVADDTLAPVCGGKARSLGRGSKMSTRDGSFIVKQRGSSKLDIARGSLSVTKDKAESVFTSKNSTKNESDVSSEKRSPPPIASTPNQKEGQRISTKPKLVNRKISSSGGKSESSSPTYERGMGRGRGRGLKFRMAAEEFPVGVVANMIEKNIGQGHRAGYDNSPMSQNMLKNNKNNNINNNKHHSNNATYFPKFDYGQVSNGRGSGWWASFKADENNKLEKNIAKVGAELGNRKLDKGEKVKVERAILSKWTPLDDSV